MLLLKGIENGLVHWKRGRSRPISLKGKVCACQWAKPPSHLVLSEKSTPEKENFGFKKSKRKFARFGVVDPRKSKAGFAQLPKTQKPQENPRDLKPTPKSRKGNFYRWLALIVELVGWNTFKVEQFDTF